MADDTIAVHVGSRVVRFPKGTSEEDMRAALSTLPVQSEDTQPIESRIAHMSSNVEEGEPSTLQKIGNSLSANPIIQNAAHPKTVADILPMLIPSGVGGAMNAAKGYKQAIRIAAQEHPELATGYGVGKNIARAKALGSTLAKGGYLDQGAIDTAATDKFFGPKTPTVVPSRATINTAPSLFDEGTTAVAPSSSAIDPVTRARLVKQGYSPEMIAKIEAKAAAPPPKPGSIATTAPVARVPVAPVTPAVASVEAMPIGRTPVAAPKSPSPGQALSRGIAGQDRTTGSFPAENMFTGEKQGLAGLDPKDIAQRFHPDYAAQNPEVITHRVPVQAEPTAADVENLIKRIPNDPEVVAPHEVVQAKPTAADVEKIIGTSTPPAVGARPMAGIGRGPAVDTYGPGARTVKGEVSQAAPMKGSPGYNPRRPVDPASHIIDPQTSTADLLKQYMREDLSPQEEELLGRALRQRGHIIEGLK